MAISRAAVLQSLVLDDDLQQYQSAAINTVQNMASSFTSIAHTMQKQASHVLYVEQSIQKRMVKIIDTLQTNTSEISDLKQQLAQLHEKVDNLDLASGRGGGSGGTSKLTQQRLRDLEFVIFGNTGALPVDAATIEKQTGSSNLVNGSYSPWSGDSKTSDNTPQTPPSSNRSKNGMLSPSGRMTVTDANRTDKSRKRAIQSGTGLIANEFKDRSKIQMLERRISDMQETLRQTTGLLERQLAHPIQASKSASIFPPRPESNRGREAEIQARTRINQKMREHEKTVTKLEENLRKCIKRVGELNTNMSRLRSNTAETFKLHDRDIKVALSRCSALVTGVEGFKSQVDERFTKFKSDLDAVLGLYNKNLETIEKHLERKADVRLVLDKVSRSEYVSQIKKLQKADNDIAGRAVPRDEYKNQLTKLRDSIHADQQQRHQNISRIANEMQKLVSELGKKASKSDLIDVASVLNGLPKMNEELDALRTFLNQEIAEKTDRILETTVDRRQLKKSMRRLLKSLQDEIMGAHGSSTCDTCAMRTGVHTGTACLSCAARLNFQSKDYYDRERAPSRGGGFVLTSPRSRDSSLDPRVIQGIGTNSILGIGSEYNPGSIRRSRKADDKLGNVEQGKNRPSEKFDGKNSEGQQYEAQYHHPKPPTNTASGEQSGFGQLKTHAADQLWDQAQGDLKSEHNRHDQDQHGYPGSLGSRLEMGADGKIYAQNGSRTHRMVASAGSMGDDQIQRRQGRGSSIERRKTSRKVAIQRLSRDVEKINSRSLRQRPRTRG